MTQIPYCQETWPVTAGCTKCEKGCAKCWAIRSAKRLKGKKIQGYGKVVDKNGWTGHIELMPWNLDKPLHWRKPRRIFVDSMSDLFHPKVPWEFIEEVFNKIALLDRHTFLIFTKRIKRAAEYFNSQKRRTESLNKDFERDGIKEKCIWPWPNLQLILSLSTKKEADEKIPILLNIPAAVRVLSLEPLLEKIDMRLGCRYRITRTALKNIDWVIIGCESLPGLKAGRFQDGFIEAARSIVRQCQNANIPVFVKQIPINGKVSHNPDEWPRDLRIQQYP